MGSLHAFMIAGIILQGAVVSASFVRVYRRWSPAALLFCMLSLLLLIHFISVYQTHVANLSFPINIKPILGVCYGPLIYLLSKATARPELSRWRKELLVLAPIAVVGALQFVGVGDLLSAGDIALRLFIYAYTFFFLIRSFRLLYRQVTRNQPLLSWLYHMVIVFIALTTLGLIDLSRLILAGDAEQDFVLVGVVGLGVLMSCSILFRRVLYPATRGSRAEGRAVPATYAKRLYSDDKRRDLIKRLKAFFETEEPFLIPGLTLDLLSEKMGIPSYVLSRVINEHFKMSFRDYVNWHRVEKAKQLLRNSDDKILAVAFESGFSNRTSFYRTFKRTTGVAPSAYRSTSQTE